MGIGGGVFLAAVGAILAFAVSDRVKGVDLHAIGLIVLVAGIVIALLDALVFLPRRRTSRTVVDDGVHAPAVVRRDDYV